MYYRPKNDVIWKVPNKKKPIAYSPKAISDFIVDLAQGGGTIEEIYEQSLNTYCVDAQEILKKYVELGYGEVEARTFFHRGYYIYKGKSP